MRKQKVKFIRLALKLQRKNNALKITKILKEPKVLSIRLNLKVSEQPKERIIEAGKLAQEYKPDVLYFADSLGRMSKKKLMKLF